MDYENLRLYQSRGVKLRLFHKWKLNKLEILETIAKSVEKIHLDNI